MWTRLIESFLSSICTPQAKRCEMRVQTEYRSFDDWLHLCLRRTHDTERSAEEQKNNNDERTTDRNDIERTEGISYTWSFTRVQWASYSERLWYLLISLSFLSLICLRSFLLFRSFVCQTVKFQFTTVCSYFHPARAIRTVVNSSAFGKAQFNVTVGCGCGCCCNGMKRAAILLRLKLWNE